MLKKIYLSLFLVLFLLASSQVKAQLERNIELEVLGQPTWEMLIPLEERGLFLLVKTDVTKVSAFRFDTELNELWRKEVFLDTEDQPKAFTITGDEISLMFSETKGMYYQVFRFNLENGDVMQQGFELREFFQDQDYVFLDDKVMMAGANDKGAAFFVQNFQTDSGQLIEQKAIEGKVKVELFEYQPESNTIESIWSVKTTGYASEKKKKGAFIKDAFVVHALLDTEGNVISKTEVKQSGGKFPMDGKLIKTPYGSKMIIGSYQSNIGDKGIYVYNLDGMQELKTYSFSKILNGNRPLDIADLQAIMKGYHLISNQPILGENRIIYGGAFFKAQFKTISNQSPYYGYSPYGSRYYNPYYMGGSRSSSQQIFQGYHYPLGFVLAFTENGDLINSNRIDINNLSFQIEPVMAYNEKGAVSYCLNGDLAANNFNIGTKPLLYKLTDEDRKAMNQKSQVYLPSYKGVKYWYDNYFIAIGSKSKIEATSVENEELRKASKQKKKGFFSKKKRQKPGSFSQIRKTIYLTKIASGA